MAAPSWLNESVPPEPELSAFLSFGRNVIAAQSDGLEVV